MKTLALEVEKAVDGLFADKSQSYAFRVTITPDAASGLAPTEERFSLMDKGTKTLRGLPIGGFTIEEIGASNYDVSFSLNGGESVSVRKNEQGNHAFSGQLSVDGTRVIVKNVLEAVPITGFGLVSPILGYIEIGFAILGAGLYTFIRIKKKLGSTKAS